MVFGFNGVLFFCIAVEHVAVIFSNNLFVAVKMGLIQAKINQVSQLVIIM